jgi:hypothetical protein
VTHAVRRSHAFAAAVLATTVPLAGCAAGQQDATSHERTSPYVADAQAGTIKVRAARVVLATGTSSSPTPSPTDTATPSGSPSASTSPSASSSTSPTGSPTPSPEASAPPAQAYLTAVIVNAGRSEDTLTGATVQGGAVNPVDPSAPLTIAPARVLALVDPQSGGTGAALEITGLTAPLLLGTTVQVTFTFADAGQVSLTVPVSQSATTA